MLIWISETQVMARRMAWSQTANLTPDHKKSGIDPIYLVIDNMRHTVQTAPWSEVYSQSYGAPKLWESRLAWFWDSHSGILGEKSHLDVGPVERSRVYYKGEGGGFPQVQAVVSLTCPCYLWLVLAPKVL